MKYLNFPFEQLAKEEGEERPANVFRGLAAAYGVEMPDWGDVIIIDRGAFKKTISENKHRIKVMYRHYELIGKPLVMEDRPEGLYVEGQVSATSVGSDVITLLRDGVLTEMSVGFDIVKVLREPLSKKVGDYQRYRRRIKEARLWEFSPVPHGRNPKAKIMHERLGDDAGRAFEAFEEAVTKDVDGDGERMNLSVLLNTFWDTMSDEQRASEDVQSVVRNMLKPEAAPEVVPVALPLDDVKRHLDTLKDWENRL